MGTCCVQLPLSEKYDTIENMRLEHWYLGNDFFDNITFNRNIQQDENNTFQRILRQGWKDKSLQGSPPARNLKPAFNFQNRIEYHYQIQK